MPLVPLWMSTIAGYHVAFLDVWLGLTCLASVSVLQHFHDIVLCSHFKIIYVGNVLIGSCFDI